MNLTYKIITLWTNDSKNIIFKSMRKNMDMMYAVNILVNNVYVWFGRSIVGIPMGTNCAPLYNDIMSTDIYDKTFKKSV